MRKRLEETISNVMTSTFGKIFLINSAALTVKWKLHSESLLSKSIQVYLWKAWTTGKFPDFSIRLCQLFVLQTMMFIPENEDGKTIIYLLIIYLIYLIYARTQLFLLTLQFVLLLYYIHLRWLHTVSIFFFWFLYFQ